MTQSGNDKCQDDSTFQAHVSHESEWHVETIRHVSIHVWRQQVYVTSKLSISGFYIASRNSTIMKSRTPKCRKGLLWVSKTRKAKLRNPIKRPCQWVMWIVWSLQRFCDHEFYNVGVTMTRREKRCNLVSRSIKKRRDQIMKFCGPLIWLHFKDCDLDCRDSSPQECWNAKILKCEMAKSTGDPVLVIQWCWILGNLIEGLLFLFTVNRSVMIQLAELNHDSLMVGNSVAETFYP